MLDSAILEVLIGLFFVYAVLSLVCSAITELITQASGMRGKTLKQGIRRLLGDVRTGNDSLVDKFYRHHLIASLSKKNKKPSYIPSRTVAATLLSMVRSAGGTDGEDMASLRENLRTSGERYSAVAEALGALLDRAENSLEKGVANIEHWIDDQMDRVSGWYRRWAQWVLLFVAFFVCAVVNADTLKIVTDLYNNPAYRKLIVAQAEQRIAQTDPEAGSGDSKDPKTTLGSLREQLSEVQPLIGWSREEFEYIGVLGPEDATKEKADAEKKDKTWKVVWRCLAKMIGLILTAFAVSLGAPFWFNLLQKLLQMRGSVKPEKSAAQADR